MFGLVVPGLVEFGFVSGVVVPGCVVLSGFVGVVSGVVVLGVVCGVGVVVVFGVVPGVDPGVPFGFEFVGAGVGATVPEAGDTVPGVAWPGFVWVVP